MFSGDRTPEVTNAARLNVAMAAEASGNDQMALQLYATALAKDPSDTQAAVRYARSLVNNRQLGLARELLSRQLASHPGHPDLSREFGTIEVMQGQPVAALPRFDTALLKNPNDVRALVNKGIALDMLGRHQEAQELYQRADTLSPDDPAVRSNLAMSLMLSGQTERATEVMQSTPGVAESSPRIRNNMAVMAAANGDMARARQLTAGEISDVELRSLASQMQSMPAQGVAPTPQPTAAQGAAPVAVAPAVVAPVAAAPAVVAPVAAAPVAVAPVDTGGAGALPLTVPGQDSAVAPAPSRPVPVTPARARTQDKPGAGRLNMTEATPAVIARVLEMTMEKEAAFIGAGPSAEPTVTLAARLPVVQAVAASPLRVHPAMRDHVAAAPVTAIAAPRRMDRARVGYSVQLASVGSEAGAQREWRVLNDRMPFFMMGREATMTTTTRPDGRSIWRLATPGFAEFTEARQFCDELKLAGRDCFVTGGRSAQATAASRPAQTGPAAPHPAAPLSTTSPEASATPGTLSPAG